MEYKAALVFGGQGSQYLGMGKELYHNSEKSKRIFGMASEVTGFDVADICFNKPDKLAQTIYSQTCILSVELSLFELFKEYVGKVDCVAGFSMGEYAALVAAEVISIEQAFALIKSRATLMEKDVPDDLGSMMAIEDFDDIKIKEILSKYGEENVAIANYNSNNQIVISYKNKYFESIKMELLEMGGRIIPLKLNRPFHHILMKPAADEFKKQLVETRYSVPSCALYMNVTGEVHGKKEKFSEQLYTQIFKPVLWSAIITNMLADEIVYFYELSPRTVLSKFIKDMSNSRVKCIDFYKEIRARKK